MEFELNLTADRAVVRESLKGVLWCIFFHRLFGPIAPSSHEFMGVTYPVASNLPDVDSLFDQKIDQLIKKDFGSADSLRQPKVGQLLISFHKNPSKIKKKSSWFGHLKDDVSQETTVWESWRINVNCRPVPPESLSADTSSVHDRGQRSYSPITTLDVSPFPYEIEIDPKSPKKPPPPPDDESWGNYIKKMLD
ncbi:hypothetical protein CJJ09_001756 [Candidozyma auris]|nr:hypothetical protein CJJ09_001756 [[Candida] auris]